MDTSNVKADCGTVEYYLNRLIQRAIVEPKPLLKIYEEECQRHPDISVTVTFKEFQSALQKYCMTLHPRPQNVVASQIKHQEMNRHNKEHSARLTSLGDLIDHRRRVRRPDVQGQAYVRMPQPVLERFSPQGSHGNNIYYRNGMQLSSAPVVNIKTEEPIYTSTSTIQLASQSISRPPSVQPPVEEEPPPEFIEMSSNPPRLSSGNSHFSGMSVYQSQVSGEQNIIPSSDGVACKIESKESDSGNTVDGAVQSSTPLDKSSPVLCSDDISPLNVRCVKCITARVTCAVMPCGHCCLCNICGQTALSLKQVCPVCRKSITTVIGYTNLIYNVYR